MSLFSSPVKIKTESLSVEAASMSELQTAIEKIYEFNAKLLADQTQFEKLKSDLRIKEMQCATTRYYPPSKAVRLAPTQLTANDGDIIIVDLGDDSDYDQEGIDGLRNKLREKDARFEYMVFQGGVHIQGIINRQKASEAKPPASVDFITATPLSLPHSEQ